MATTSTRIQYLANGVRDTAGAVVASAVARFYNPGTTVQQTVYSDAACSTAMSQPVTCNAAGQATVYCLEAVRMIVKSSDETTTYYDDVVNLTRADSVYVTVDGINSGTETTLEDVLGDIGDSFGSGFQYKESSTATARNYVDVIRNLAIQAEDFGVVADGTTDDTSALQAAINRVKALSGGRVLLPTGTILISSALTIDTAGVSIEGSGRGISIIKNSSTTGNCLNVTLASGDAKLFLKGFSITASTTSSGKAINCSVGNHVVIEDVGVGLHRTGIDVNAITGGQLRHCFVDSTDDNASAIGINLGASGEASRCEVASGTDNGTGVKLTGTDARALNCYVTNFATGYNLAGARGHVKHCHSAGTTSGFSVGAVADCVVAECTASTCTTDLTLNNSATGVVAFGNNFATNSGGTATTRNVQRLHVYEPGANVSDPVTFTPLVSSGENLNVFLSQSVTEASITIAAPTGYTSLLVGDVLELIIANTGGNNTAGLTWNAIYKSPSGTNEPQTTAITAGNKYSYYRFRWTGTVFKVVNYAVNLNWDP